MKRSDMLPLIAVFILAESADLVTWTRMNPATHVEGNPLVTFLGPLAGPAKVVLVALVSALAYHIPNAAVAAVLIFGTVVSIFGALSNIL